MDLSSEKSSGILISLITIEQEYKSRKSVLRKKIVVRRTIYLVLKEYVLLLFFLGTTSSIAKLFMSCNIIISS